MVSSACAKTWSEFKDCGMNKCIKKQTFRDGVVNCPFLNCPDEEGCDVHYTGKCLHSHFKSFLNN